MKFYILKAIKLIYLFSKNLFILILVSFCNFVVLSFLLVYFYMFIYIF